jgi:hypothetical protein
VGGAPPHDFSSRLWESHVFKVKMLLKDKRLKDCRSEAQN